MSGAAGWHTASPGLLDEDAVIAWIAARRAARRISAPLLLCAASFAPPPAKAQEVAAPRCPAAESVDSCLTRALSIADTAFRRPDTEGGDVGIGRTALTRPLQLLQDVCDRGLGDGCYFRGRFLFATPSLFQSDTAIDAVARNAAALFRSGCVAARPSGAACNSAGDAFRLGIGLASDPDSALAYYHRGCQLGHPTACSGEAARLAERPEMGPGRFEIAYRQSVRACEMGSPSACGSAAAYRAARLAATPPGLRGTQGFLRQRAELLNEHRRICNAGRGLLASCAALGAMYSDPRFGVVHRDSSTRYYNLGCTGTTRSVRGRPRPGGRLGSGQACGGLAALALATTPPDSAAAHSLYGTGCELFDAESCVGSGQTLRPDAQGGSGTDAKLHQFVSACIALEASSAGCEAAGATFARELGDTAQAKRFYRRACDLGNGLGCVALGTLERGPQGDSAAVQTYYRRGCVLGAGSACVGLAQVLLDRFADDERAERLMRHGCQLGSAAGCWRAMLAFIQAGDEENSAVYRTAACRLSRAYCKRSNSAGVEPEP